MNKFLDEDSKKIITSAKEEMFNLKHPYVGTEHLLLGILNNKDLSVTKELEYYDITYEIFKDKLIESVGVGSNYNKWYLFTPLLKSVIDSSIQFSKNNVVTPKELLISILSQGDGVANRILLSMNIDIKYLSTRLS